MSQNQYVVDLAQRTTQIYKKSLQRQLADMKDARRVHAIDLLKTRVIKARSMSAEIRCAMVP